MSTDLIPLPSENRTAILDFQGQRVRLENTTTYLSGVHVEPNWWQIRGRSYVYFHLDRDGNTVYIGKSTSGLTDRLRQHSKTSPWFPGIESVLVDEWPTAQDAREVEARLIRRFRPLFNRDRCDGTYQSPDEFRAHLAAFYSGRNPHTLRLSRCQSCAGRGAVEGPCRYARPVRDRPPAAAHHTACVRFSACLRSGGSLGRFPAPEGCLAIERAN
jgi:hypothetical protein